MPGWIYIPTAGGTWEPDDVSNLVVWLDAADTSFSNNDAVSAWTNKGSGGNTAQSTSGKRPVFKTNLLNGKPGVDFDGTDDCLTIASLALDTYISVFIVAKTTTSKAFLVEHSANANNNDGFYFYGDATAHYTVRRTNKNAYVGTVSWFGSAAAQAGLIINAISSVPNPMGKVYKNGTVQADGLSIYTDSLSDSSVTATLNIGARDNGSAAAMDGDLHELIIYNDAISTGDREKVEGYLAHKWGLTADLPGAHPYKNSAP